MREVLQTLERGIEMILTSDGYRDYLTAMSRFHGYSGLSHMMLALPQRR